MKSKTSSAGMELLMLALGPGYHDALRLLKRKDLATAEALEKVVWALGRKLNDTSVVTAVYDVREVIEDVSRKDVSQIRKVVEHAADLAGTIFQANDPVYVTARSKTAGSGYDLLMSILGERDYIQIFDNLEGDEQSQELLHESLTVLARKFDLSSSEEAAFNRLANMVHDGKHWNQALLRNNVFKIADSLGIKLPSGMFASAQPRSVQRVVDQHMSRVASNRVTKIDVKLKNGDVIPKGTPVTVKYMGDRNPGGSKYCFLEMDYRGDSGRDYHVEPMKVQIERLPTYVSGFKIPGIRQMEKWMDAGIAMTPSGQRVEPDGWGRDGSPSWLLALSYI